MFGLVFAQLLHVVKAVVVVGRTQVGRSGDGELGFGEGRGGWAFGGGEGTHAEVFPFLFAGGTGDLLLAAKLLHLAGDELPVFLVKGLFGLVEVVDLRRNC